MIHDNARFSQSKYTKSYLQESGYADFFIEQPTYSPDMNLIENLWAILKFRVKNHIFKHGQPRLKHDFIELISNTWKSIDSEIIERLYLSLNKRMQSIIDSEGDLTKY